MMRSLCLSFVASLTFAGFVVADDYKVETTTERPEVPAAIGEQLGESGLRITGPKRGLCDVWFAKSVAVEAGFEKTGTITYPFTPGQFVGVMVVPRRAELLDFKGHEIAAGTYTLRYGRQPQDGNHVGTSETLDFLLAIPVDKEESPAGIEDQDQLVERSAGASGTTHPAIFSLLPIEAVEGDAKVVEVGDHGWMALETTVQAEAAKVPVKLVVVGVSEG